MKQEWLVWLSCSLAATISFSLYKSFHKIFRNNLKQIKQAMASIRSWTKIRIAKPIFSKTLNKIGSLLSGKFKYGPKTNPFSYCTIQYGSRNSCLKWPNHVL